MEDVRRVCETSLYPCVRIRTPKAKGSGTVLFMEPAPDELGLFDAYVLTNHHVIDDLVTVDKKWNSVLKKDAQTETLGHPEVDRFQYNYMSRMVGATSVQADIVAWDKDEDMALLRVRSDISNWIPAKLLPEEDINKLAAFMQVWNVGCGLGGPPAITAGYLSAFGVDIDDKDYMLVTAPSIFGSSGGATFLQDGGWYIGIPARISLIPMGWSADIITHLGFSITLARIYAFLREQYFSFIIDPETTSAKCAEARKRARDWDLRQRRELDEDDYPVPTVDQWEAPKK